MTTTLSIKHTKAGETLLNAINSLTQIAKMHSDNNALLLQSAENFIRLLNTLSQADPDISIQHAQGRFYFQSEKLPIRPSNARLLTRMLRFLENRAIYGFHFQIGLDRPDLQTVIEFFRMTDQAIGHESPSRWLADQCAANQWQWVSVDTTPHSDLSDPLPLSSDPAAVDALAVRKAQVRKSYAHALSSVKEVARKLASRQGVGMRNSVRLVQKMVDIISEDESLFLGISTIRIYDDYTYVHSLNVAILSMCLGKQIGLPHDALERLGLCGLFHDLGKVVIPKELLNKKERLNKSEFELLKTHAMHSARLILKLKAQRERKTKLLVPPFEHHMGYDHSGYPKTTAGPGISLFGRILTIADVYDAITSPRIYRQTILSPDRALADMLSRSGTHFDPILLKVFINMLGAYPVGTLLKLDSGEIGIVVKPSEGADRTRPVVQLLVPDVRPRFKKGDIVDLGEKDLQTGTHRRNICSSMHPAVMGIQAAEFLLH